MKKRLPLTLLTLLLLLPLTAQSAHRHDDSRIKNPEGKQYIYRYTLRDKHHSSYRLDHPLRWLSRKAVERRRRQHLKLDSTDLPVSPYYLTLFQLPPKEAHSTATTIIGTSRWMNTVLVRSRDTLTLQRLAALDCVAEARCVWQSPDSIERRQPTPKVHTTWQRWDSIPGDRYAHGREQIEMLNGQQLHEMRYRGRGMTIAVLDGGFQNVDQLRPFMRTHIDGVYDFVSRAKGHAPSLFAATDHGTKVLSTMAMDEQQVLTGTAPEAHYWLLRCEDQESEQEVEEDYWVMAAEMADSAGADLINSSLGYNEYDHARGNHRQSELDGSTAFCSRAASLLADKGMVLVCSAGNTGMGTWKRVCVPADAHRILTVGAVGPDGVGAPFAAVGPTQDGRVKPDVVALGAPAALLSGRGSVVHDMGTSFSTPVVCGLVACLWQSLPGRSAIDIINLVRKTSDNYKTPNNVYGYGLPNFWRAYLVGTLE